MKVRVHYRDGRAVDFVVPEDILVVDFRCDGEGARPDSSDRVPMISDPNRIEIRDESTHEEQRFQLYIDGGRRALLSKKHGTVQFYWQGPKYWPEAKVLMQGLLELSVLADQLSGEKNGK